MTPRVVGVLQVLGAADIVSGAVALVAASWFADQIDVGATAVRVAGGLLVLLGIDTIVMAARPVMAKATVAAEALAALLAVDLLIVGNPTGIGTALLVGTAIWCAAVAVELALLQRTRPLVAA